MPPNAGLYYESAIRDGKRNPVPGYAVTRDYGILSSVQYRTFWIQVKMIFIVKPRLYAKLRQAAIVSNQFSISVGRGGENVAFMNHTWDHQNPVNYVAFASSNYRTVD